ncbi:hypothetical protein VTH06DRAFT_1738 [Thermothelomyces fergusii]
MDPPRTIIIGISGCSSSGKTTLARLLRDMFPETFILHEDDFYKPESELPIKDGFADWDCPEAISIPDLEAALAHPNVNSLEDLNTVGPCPASPDQIAACAAKVRDWLSPNRPGSLIFPPKPSSSSSLPPSSSSSSSSPTTTTKDAPNRPKTRVCILDGFLLYTPTTPTPTPTISSPLRGVTAQLDVKLFLQASRAAAVGRRVARDGYVHADGFWKDPPGYVERVVWPNYAAAHRWLFARGDVDAGRLDRAVLRRERILTPAFGLDLEGGAGETGGEGGEGKEEEVSQDIEFGKILEWAVEVVMRELERLCLGEKDGAGKEERGEGKRI